MKKPIDILDACEIIPTGKMSVFQITAGALLTAMTRMASDRTGGGGRAPPPQDRRTG